MGAREELLNAVWNNADWDESVDLAGIVDHILALHAHELAEKIRKREWGGQIGVGRFDAADLIDPFREVAP